MAKRIEYVEGQQVGECIFVRETGFIISAGSKMRTAIFKCQCGNLFKKSIKYIKTRNNTSCGCHIGFVSKQKKDINWKDGKKRFS